MTKFTITYDLVDTNTGEVVAQGEWTEEASCKEDVIFELGMMTKEQFYDRATYKAEMTSDMNICKTITVSYERQVEEPERVITDDFDPQYDTDMWQ